MDDAVAKVLEDVWQMVHSLPGIDNAPGSELMRSRVLDGLLALEDQLKTAK